MSICSPKPHLLLLSTPLSKTTSEASPPSTPNKKPKYTETEQYSLNNVPTSPSKPLRFHPHTIKTAPNNVSRQSLHISRFPMTTTFVSPETNKNLDSIFNYRLTPDETDDRLNIGRSPMYPNSLLTPSPSPLGEVSPFLDKSPEYDKPAAIHQTLKGATVSSNSTIPIINDILSHNKPNLKKPPFDEHSDTFHEILHSNIWAMSNLLPSSSDCDNDNRNESNTTASKTKRPSLDVPMDPRPLKIGGKRSRVDSDDHRDIDKPICVPRHRSSKPRKPILTIPMSSLNLIVGSSKGSLQDATIFATEINALVDGSVNKLPVISNEWERVTIPVNSAVKENYKRMKLAIFGDDEALDSTNHGYGEDASFGTSDIEKFMMDGDADTSIHSSGSDVALIRGFKFKSSSEHVQENGSDKNGRICPTLRPGEGRSKKAVRWAL